MKKKVDFIIKKNNVESMYIEIGHLIPNINPNKRIGYKFICWEEYSTLHKESYGEYDFTKPLSHDIELRAKWVRDEPREIIVIDNIIYKLYEDPFFVVEGLETRSATTINILDNIIVKGTEYPVLVIKNKAFESCIKVESISFGNVVSIIGEDSFTKCKSLKTINFPKNIMTIGPGAFSYCDSLTNVFIPKTVQFACECIFMCCKKINTVTFEEGCKFNDGFYGAFYRCNSLENVTLASSLKEVSKNAFAHCNSLKEIIIPEGIEVIEEEAFRESVNFEKITIPQSLHTIQEGAFRHCNSLTEINLHDNIVTIETDAFSCTKIDKLYFGNKIENITGKSIINRVDDLVVSKDNPLFIMDNGMLLSKDKTKLIKVINCNEEKLIIPEGIKVLCTNCISSIDCSSISLPESLIEIQEEALRWCENLEEIYLPKKLKKIAPKGFYYCEKTTIYTYYTKEEIEKFDFMNSYGSYGGINYWYHKSKVVYKNNKEILKDTIKDTEVCGASNIVLDKDIKDTPIPDFWKNVFSLENGDERNNFVSNVWKDMGYYEVGQMLYLGLNTIQLEFKDEKYRIVYIDTFDQKFYGNINPNVKEDMIQKFGGIDPVLLDFTTTLHDGFYREKTKGNVGFLPTISQMKTTDDVKMKYVDETKLEFTNKTVFVALDRKDSAIARNVDHLDYYFKFSDKKLSAIDSDGFIRKLDAIILNVLLF